ncbi:GRIP1-associated protein 1-like [Polyodon spathula]|uniref:GRIP1-associated protein 1-like n=1 Tax=Polyodon spathula TaxID=7913 RepID=UPI001B7DAFED|nr:GRIP1-associated protein 1-like [Polyodon spathula]
MAQAASEEEFHRMQAQLLELRTQNYQQSDDLSKNTAELNASRQKNFSKEKDLTKALKETIEKNLLEKQDEIRALHEEHAARLQEIEDTVDGQRILEKKDLKRQLQLERKRADKLQERLQEILTNFKTKTGLEDLVLSEIHSSSHAQAGNSSSCLFQLPGDDERRDSNTKQQQVEHRQPSIHASCRAVLGSCFRGWLKSSRRSECWREDVSVAAAGTHGGNHDHPERGILGTVLRDLVKPGNENLREMNKKLQNMLEEQLTKNMHLQKDLEILSREIVLLSKECSSTHVRDQYQTRTARGSLDQPTAPPISALSLPVPTVTEPRSKEDCTTALEERGDYRLSENIARDTSFRGTQGIERLSIKRFLLQTHLRAS